MNGELFTQLLTAMGILLGAAIINPLFSKNRKLAGWINFILVTAASVILLNISYVSIFRADGNLFNLGALTRHLTATTFIPIGQLKLYFLVDAFSAFFLAIIAFMAVISAFYSIRYMDHYEEYGVWSYYLNYPIFILGMVGMVTVDDLSVGFTVAWQLMTVASFFLIRFEHRKKKIVKNANKYLALMELAWLFIIGGTLFINNVYAGDSLHTLVEKMGATPGTLLFAVYGLILVGFGFKAAVFPLGQLWLPDAHSVAPSPISSLLSGVMIKTGVYGIIRTFFWMVPEESAMPVDGFFWGIVIASFGVATLFIGTVQSMKQSDAKRLLAYSSIGQVGYIILAVGAALLMFNMESPAVTLLAVVAMVGALYHVLNHAVFKGLLFLTSGSMLYATGEKDLNRLGGLATLMPVTAVIAGIASLSISGVPPFSGFASKWSIISSSLLAGSEAPFLVLFGIVALFTSAVTLSCYVKYFGMAFTSSGVEWNGRNDVKEVPALMIIPKVVLTLLCVVQGLFPFFYYRVFVSVMKTSGGSIVEPAFRDFIFGRTFTGEALGVGFVTVERIVASVAVPLVILAVVAAAFVLAWLLRNSGGAGVRECDTWLCGYKELAEETRYKDRHMFSALKKLLWWTGGNVKEK